MTRRSFLLWSALQSLLFPLEPSTTLSRGRASKHLILIELRGGNDGLNTVVPYSDPLYRHSRPRIALPERELLPLDSELALHPSLAPLREIYERGELALVLGLGYPHPNRSHFRSIEIWDTASGPESYLNSGWLESLEPSGSEPLKGIVLGGHAGPLSGARHGVVRIDDPRSFLNRSKRIRAQIYPVGTNEALNHLLQTEAEIRKSANLLQRYLQHPRPLPVPFRPTPLGRQLQVAARLICQGIPTPFFKLSFGSFDTHTHQLPKQARLLTELSTGLETLRKNLMACGRWDETLVMTYSEFGRRVAENASAGTDHGTAAPHFVLGGKVRGGRYGTQPSLRDLDGNGDLKYSTDFRALYHTIAADWLQAHSPRLKRFPKLSFLSSQTR